MNRYNRSNSREHVETWLTGIIMVIALYGALIILSAW